MEVLYRLPASPCNHFNKVQAQHNYESQMSGSVGCGREFQGLGRAANILKSKPAPSLKSTSLGSRSLRKCNTGPINVTSALHIPGMKLVFVSAEVAPWSKTGGLGDVLVSDTFEYIIPPRVTACNVPHETNVVFSYSSISKIGIRCNLTLYFFLSAGGSSTCIGGIFVVSPRAIIELDA